MTLAKVISDKRIKVFLNKQLAQKIVEHAVLKKELFMFLPYLGSLPVVWEYSYKKAFHFVKLKLLLNHQLRSKIKIPLCLPSNIVYKFACGRCSTT